MSGEAPSQTATPGDDDLLATPDAGPAAIRGGAVRVGGYLAGALISAISAALLFRHLGVVGFGLYTIALSLVAVVDGLSDLGLTAIGVRELSILRGPARRELARNLLGLRVALTVIGVAVMIGFSAVVGYRPVVVKGVLLAGTGLLLQSCQASLGISLMSRLRLGWVTAIDLLRQVVTVSLIVALVLIGAHLLAFLAVPIAAAGTALVATGLLVRGDVSLIPAFERQRWRALISVVLPYSVAVAAATIYFRIAIVLVSLLASARQLGFFSASFRVIEVLLLVPGLLAGSVLPIFARAASEDPERLRYAVDRVFRVTLIIGAGTALALGVGAPLAIEVLGGASFRPAAAILAVQGIGLGAAFVGTMYSNVLLSLRRYREILLVNCGALLVGSGLVAGLVTVDAARGAAIATAVTETCVATASALFAARVDARLAPSLEIVPRVALAAAIGAAAVFIPAPLVVRLVIAVLLYLVSLIAQRAIPPEVMHELRQLHPRYARAR